MEIPELFKQWIGSGVRFALTAIFTYLVAKGIITAEMSAQTITAVTGALATLAWSFYQKWAALKKAEAGR